MNRLRSVLRLPSSVLCLAVVCLSGCAKRNDPGLSSGRMLDAATVRTEMAGAFVGDAVYSQVNSAALAQLYADFREEIFRKGVIKWDERFDCNHFANYYVALAQTKFYLANFQSATPAQSLAVGTFWYRSVRGPHAIVVALTERGTVFIEPQTGAEIALSKAEGDSAWLKVF